MLSPAADVYVNGVHWTLGACVCADMKATVMVASDSRTRMGTYSPDTRLNASKLQPQVR
jgi:hypothetical protein